MSPRSGIPHILYPKSTQWSLLSLKLNFSQKWMNRFGLFCQHKSIIVLLWHNRPQPQFYFGTCAHLTFEACNMKQLAIELFPWLVPIEFSQLPQGASLWAELPQGVLELRYMYKALGSSSYLSPKTMFASVIREQWKVPQKLLWKLAEALESADLTPSSHFSCSRIWFRYFSKTTNQGFLGDTILNISHSSTL